MNDRYPSKDQAEKIRIDYELYPNTEFDIENELAAQKNWQEGGRSCEPMQIGHFGVSSEVLQVLEGQDWQNYVMRDEPAEYQDEVTPEVYEYLRQIWAELNKITTEDMDRSGIDPSGVMWDDKLSAGLYVDAGGMDEAHCDDPSALAIRYAAVVCGRATRFYTGDIPYELFDQEGNLKDNLPEDAVEKSYPQLSVIRFTSAGGIHSAPTPDGKPRIFLDSTAILDLNEA